MAWSLLVFCGTVNAMGCATSWRPRDAAQIVAARQLTLRGLEQLQEGDLASAEASFQRAVEASPHDERARFQYAKTLWQRSASAEALQHMTEAVRLSEGNSELLVELGEMHLALSDLPGAERCAERAIATDPQCAAAHLLYGNVARRLGRYDLALEHYHWALDAAESLPAAQIAAAEIYQKKANPRRALSSLQPLDPSKLPTEQAHRVLLLRGIAHKELGRPQDAIRSLSTSIVQAPPNAELLHHLAEAHFLTGDMSTAAQVARRALELDSSRANTQSLLARIQSHSPRVAMADKPTQ
jgi:tetratricopeptide (TPR) repeat protein